MVARNEMGFDLPVPSCVQPLPFFCFWPAPVPGAPLPQSSTSLPPLPALAAATADVASVVKREEPASHGYIQALYLVLRC